MAAAASAAPAPIITTGASGDNAAAWNAASAVYALPTIAPRAVSLTRKKNTNDT